MEIYEWKEGMTPQEEADGAYWERNMLALYMASYMNLAALFNSVGKTLPCGWYYDTDNNWEGFKRVISLERGKITFHIPDDFDVGGLPQIEPNWDGHTTKEKWLRMMKECHCKIGEEAQE